MSIVIDRRNEKYTGKVDANRQKLINRHKAAIKDQLDTSIDNIDITDMAKSKKIKVSIDNRLHEHRIKHEEKSNYNIVVAGNTHPVGYKSRISAASAGGAGKGKGKKTKTSLSLSFKEFLDIYFDGMVLPNFIKKSNDTIVNESIIRAGYSKTGPINMLDIKKSFEQAIARRLIEKSYLEKPPFLIDEDLRFRHFATSVKKNKKAVVFLILDSSGSMSYAHRRIAKRIFILSYIFLTQAYKDIDIVFIKHTDTAEIVADAHQFINEEISGGTVLSSGLNLALDTINSNYADKSWNRYIVHISDGDNAEDDYIPFAYAVDALLDKVQYLMYVEINDYRNGPTYKLLQRFREEFSNINSWHISTGGDPVELVREMYKE